MALDITRGSVPLFRRIADTLADAIGRGDYAVGSQLPTEFKLMRMFGASRFTIREALGELRAAGLISSRRGSGSVVERMAPQKPTFGEGYRSLDVFLAGVTEAPIEVQSITDVVADAALAASLGCDEGRQFLALRGIRRRRDHPEEPPLALVHVYINATYSAIRPHLMTLTESIASTMEKRLGICVQRIAQEFEPILLTADEAAPLAAQAAQAAQAALLVRRSYYLDNGELLMSSRSIYPQGRLVYRTELRRGGSAEG